MYIQDLAREEIRTVLDSLGIDLVHVIGLSLSGFAALHFGLRYPDRALLQVISGCGHGADEGSREQFQRETTEAENRMESETLAVFGSTYALEPARVQFKIRIHVDGKSLKYSSEINRALVLQIRWEAFNVNDLLCTSCMGN